MPHHASEIPWWDIGVVHMQMQPRRKGRVFIRVKGFTVHSGADLCTQAGT